MKFKNLPIKKKIIFVIMLTCLSALFVSGSIFFAFQIKSYTSELRQEMGSIASLIGFNSQAAIEFDDQKAALEILSGLKQDKRIRAAKLMDSEGNVFAAFENAMEAGEEGLSDLIISQPIYLNEKHIGSITINVNTMRGFYKRLWEFAAVAILTILLSGMAAYAISSRLQSVISKPIAELAETARKVSLEKNYTLRAEKHSDDEIGVLIEQFNEMMEQIRIEDSRRKKAEDDLKILNEKLEARVAERTAELKDSLEKLRRSERLASIGKFLNFIIPLQILPMKEAVLQI